MRYAITAAVLVPLIFALVCIAGPVAAGEISEITVTPDGRRVAIKSESRMGRHTEQVAGNPSRLIIDVSGTGITKVPRISGVTDRSPMDIRAAKTASGARVVLDFGRQPVPDHKVLRMDNYLIVFLGQGTARMESDARLRPERIQPKEPQAVPVVSMPRKKLPANDVPDASDLSIQSAEIIDGLIVLKVSNKSDPSRAYKIDLGVDFRQLGFSTARISPLREIVGSSQSVPAAEGLRDRRMGPRKLQRNLMADSLSDMQEDSGAQRQ